MHLPRPEDAVLLDRTGRLTRAARQLADFQPPEPEATARQLTAELANWTLMLAHILARGEVARAHTVIAPQQLQLCRLLRDSTAHWLTVPEDWAGVSPLSRTPRTVLGALVPGVLSPGAATPILCVVRSREAPAAGGR